MSADKWAPAKVCVVNRCRILESQHPILAGFWLVDKIHFPGTSHISIVFDSLTDLGDNISMCFYMDSACLERIGVSYSGSAVSGNWPGVAGTAPLVVLADTVTR